MSSTARGRPRRTRSTSGLGTEEDVLAAAGELFCAVGYGSTSTHAIARRAGVSQASIYHYFAGKQAILAELLLRTVRPSVRAAAELAGSAAADDVRLWALCRLDARLLASGEHNIGSLYLIPELYAPDPDGDPSPFADFHAERATLRRTYETLARSVEAARGEPVGADPHLVFELVESVVMRRRMDPDLDPESVARSVADAALRLLGVDEARLAVVRQAQPDADDGADFTQT